MRRLTACTNIDAMKECMSREKKMNDNESENGNNWNVIGDDII